MMDMNTTDDALTSELTSTAGSVAAVVMMDDCCNLTVLKEAPGGSVVFDRERGIVTVTMRVPAESQP